jgi:hypothetical protein
MTVVEVTTPGADKAACPARGTDEAAFPARCTDEAACPAHSAHKASRPASGADENFPSTPPLTLTHGHSDESLIDSDNETLIAEYSFVQGDADDDSVRNTHTARDLYGQSSASEEVIEEADLHIKTHQFRAMKSIITKSIRLASMGKTNF